MTIKKTTGYWHRGTGLDERITTVLSPGSRQRGELFTASEDQKQIHYDEVVLKILDENTICFAFDDGRNITLSGEAINQDSLVLDRGFKEKYSLMERLSKIFTGRDRSFSKIEWEKSEGKGGKER